MKKTIFTIIAILTLVTTTHAGDWKSQWTLNGIPLKNFAHLNGKDGVQLGAGILASFAVHTAGHLLYLESQGKSWHMEGRSEICDDILTQSQQANFGRAGFIGQLFVGSILKLSKWDKSWFVTGYHIGSFFEIATYPLFNKNYTDQWGPHGDLALIDQSGSGNGELILYNTWAVTLLIKDWRPK